MCIRDRDARTAFESRSETKEVQLPVGIGNTVQVTVFGHASGNELPSYVSQSHVAGEGGGITYQNDPPE
eukprot:7940685-Prorocentrum_lima.AAC.1